MRARRLDAWIAAAGSDLDLFERIEVIIGGRTADRADIGDVHAIDVERLLRIGGPSSDYDVLLTAFRAADVYAIELNARRQTHDDEWVATGRKLLQFVVRDDRARSGLARIDQRRICCDRD